MIQNKIQISLRATCPIPFIYRSIKRNALVLTGLATFRVVGKPTLPAMERRGLGAPKIKLVMKQGCHLDRVVVARHMRDEPITEPDDPAILHIEVGAVLAYSTPSP